MINVSIIIGIMTGAINGCVKLMQDQFIAVMKKGRLMMANDEKIKSVFDFWRRNRGKIKYDF